MTTPSEKTMKAIVVADDEGKSLKWDSVQRPALGAKEVLVRVRATALNRADLLQRIGKYPPPKGASDILGLEAAGEVVACGAEAGRWKIGDRVCALLPGGGYAEYVACNEGVLLSLPESISFEHGAALPEALYTAYLNLFVEGQLQMGERALVHAGGSGIGTMAIQLCAAMQCPVYATASVSKLDAIRDLGADAAIDRNGEDFVAQVKALTEGKGVDVILDVVGGAYLTKNIQALARGGRLVVIGLLGGPKGELPLATLLMKRQRIIGSVLRGRSIEEKAALTREIEQSVWPLIQSGKVKAVVQQVFAISDAEKAHDLMRSNETVGKIVLTVDPS